MPLKLFVNTGLKLMIVPEPRDPKFSEIPSIPEVSLVSELLDVVTKTVLVAVVVVVVVVATVVVVLVVIVVVVVAGVVDVVVVTGLYGWPYSHSFLRGSQSQLIFKTIFFILKPAFQQITYLFVRHRTSYFVFICPYTIYYRFLTHL